MDYEDLAPVPPRPANWTELFAITGGLMDIPIEVIERGRADHPYHFSSTELKKCGRRGCERRHCNGFLVAISGRRFVHIGHCCARRYVTDPDRWNANLRAMRRRAHEEAQAEAMVLASREAQRTLHWMDNDPTIDSAIRALESFLQQAGGPIRAELEKRAEKGRVQVEIHRRLSAEERDAKRVMVAGHESDNKPIWVDAFEPVIVGELVGIQCLRPRRGPRELKGILETMIWTLLKWDPTAPGALDVKAVQQAVRELGTCTRDLKESIRNVEKFLTPRNLELICRLDVSRSQGVRSIHRKEDSLEIVRSPHWGNAA